MMTSNAPHTNVPDDRHHVVVVGGGFAGLNCVKSLANDPKIRVTLVDRRNHHLFQPLLYQVATGMLSPADVASPFRYVLRDSHNTHVYMAEVKAFDVAKKEVIFDDGAITYDTLIVATGSHHHYFGKDEWAEFAPGLKSLNDALVMREKILKAFEMAEREEDADKRRALLTFVIVGGGPTGVELAGSVAELIQRTLKGQFRRAQLSEARIIMAEGSPRVLPVYSENLSASAKNALEDLAIDVRTKTLVTELSNTHAILTNLETKETTRVETHTVLWGAGVGASGLGKLLADQTSAETDRMGRVMVEKDFSIPSHPNVFVAGDLAHYAHREDDDMPIPGIAPAAMQAGNFIATAVKAKVYGYEVPEFAYNDKGSMAIIGNNKAVASVKGYEMEGFVAWLAWLFIHVMFLVENDNKAIVAFNWCINYLTNKRATRLITNNILPFFTHPIANVPAKELAGSSMAD